MKLLRANAENKDFIKLVNLLDIDLAKRDGNEHAFYAQFNKIDNIKYVVIAFDNKIAVGCGAIKQFDKKTVEIKRMYTSENNRGKGAASLILSELEKWAAELSYEKCVLETGTKQPEAIALYKKSGYKLIANYGQYTGIENSKCFEKVVKKSTAQQNL
ncbi:MAG: GNAT family N-acetyltransferase [Crocinitomicaceae bacterium]